MDRPSPTRRAWARRPPPEAGEVQLRARCALRMKLLRPPRAAQQKHALLAEHVPKPPGQIQPQRAAVEIEGDRAFHLDVDLVAELDEILDGAEMDVRRVVPGGREVFGAWPMAADQKVQPHPPEAEIRE